MTSHQIAPRFRPGRFMLRMPAMTHQPANRPRIAVTYASGTVRARRWHGDGDVRGYRPPRGWTARADLTDLHPHGPRLAARRVVDHRNRNAGTGPKPCRLGAGGETPRGGGRARFHCSCRNAPSPPSDRRRWGHAQGARARNPRSQQVWRRIAPPTIRPSPAAMGGWCGYAPACCGRLHESVPSPTLAVRCLYVTKDGSPTRRPASLLWSFHTTPQYVAVSCGRRSGLVVGALTGPRQGASRCSRHAGMPSWPRLHSGAGGLCVLVLL